MHQHEILRKISNARSRYLTIQKKIIRMLKINPWIYTANKEVLAKIIHSFFRFTYILSVHHRGQEFQLPHESLENLLPLVLVLTPLNTQRLPMFLTFLQSR